MEKNTPKPFFFEGRKRTKILTASACLLIAFVIWIFNALSNDYNTIIKYPVKLVYSKTNIITTDQNQKKIDLAVSGYGWTLLSYSLSFRQDPIPIYPAELGDQKMMIAAELLPKCKERLKEIKVNQVLSDTISFEFDKLVTRTIFLKLDTRSLNLPARKTITKPELSPEFILCKGPEKMIKSLPDTIKFGLGNRFIEKDFNEPVDINYRPSPYISTSERSVHVSFKVK